jgi:hypothetical protein
MNQRAITKWLGPAAAAVLVAALAAGCASGLPDSDARDADQPGPPGEAALVLTDIAAEVGLDFQHGAFRWNVSEDAVAMMGGGLCWLDFDNDGWLDLYVVNSYAETEWARWQDAGGLPRSALFRNEAGQFRDVSQESGAGLEMRGNGCVAADFDLDGWTDLYVTTARFNHLLWNQGDGTFIDGAEAAGVNTYGWQTGAAVADVNGDDLPDLFVAGYVDLNNRLVDATKGFPNTHEPVNDLLYLNEGPGNDGLPTFRDVAVELGLETGVQEYGLGALFTDLDDDGDVDLYVANDTNPNRLYEVTRGDVDSELGFRLHEVAEVARVADENSGMGVASGDYDGDGRFDLFITNFGRQLHSLYRNDGGDELSFEEGLQDFGVADLGVGLTGWGTAWADLDLDTRVELIVVHGEVPVTDPAADAQLMQILAVSGDAGYQPLTTAGLDDVGPILGRGSAVADYDNDGDLDIAINTIGGNLLLLENAGAAGNWLVVEFDGFFPGAMVTATLPDGTALRRELHAGSSYLSSEDPRLHFGLGDAERVAELVVRWPDGSTTVVRDVEVNQRVRVVAN